MPYYNRDPKGDHNFDNHPYVSVCYDKIVWCVSALPRLAKDAYERNAGMIFEYGHTVSHAIEKAQAPSTSSSLPGSH